ncbi:LTP_2 domain-containing protein, partial [Cephalotus follicularis]
IATTSLLLLFLISHPPNALSQDPITPGPTITDCAARLLPLTPCAPFVQGSVQSPAQMCCDNLKQLYSQQPLCLCLLLNDTTLGSLPINTTLALHLPLVCNLQVDTSACSGVPVPPPASAGSQVSLGTKTNSSGENSNATVGVASPVVQVTPRPTFMGFGFGRSAAVKPKKEGPLAVVGAVAA